MSNGLRPDASVLSNFMSIICVVIPITLQSSLIASIYLFFGGPLLALSMNMLTHNRPWISVAACPQAMTKSSAIVSVASFGKMFGYSWDVCILPYFELSLLVIPSVLRKHAINK